MEGKESADSFPQSTTDESNQATNNISRLINLQITDMFGLENVGQSGKLHMASFTNSPYIANVKPDGREDER